MVVWEVVVVGAVLVLVVGEVVGEVVGALLVLVVGEVVGVVMVLVVGEVVGEVVGAVLVLVVGEVVGEVVGAVLGRRLLERCWCWLLPARASEQVSVCHQIKRTRDLIYLKFVATDFSPKIMSPSAGENSGDSA